MITPLHPGTVPTAVKVASGSPVGGEPVRAEPVAALFEAGRAFHVGALDALEDELCGLLAAGGYAGPGRSPDRADAMVWAMTEVMLRGRGGMPGVRVV